MSDKASCTGHSGWSSNESFCVGLSCTCAVTLSSSDSNESDVGRWWHNRCSSGAVYTAPVYNQHVSEIPMARIFPIACWTRVLQQTQYLSFGKALIASLRHAFSMMSLFQQYLRCHWHWVCNQPALCLIQCFVLLASLLPWFTKHCCNKQSKPHNYACCHILRIALTTDINLPTWP